MRQIHWVFALASLVLGTAVLAGCDPSFTSSAQESAAIRVLGLPAGIGAGYGEQLATATDPDSKMTMAFVSAKNVSTYGMYNIWREERLAITDDGDPLGAGCGSCNAADIGDDVFGLGAFVTTKNDSTTICGAAAELGCPGGAGENCAERLRGVGLNCGGAENVVDDLLRGEESDGVNIGRAFAALHAQRLLSVDNDNGELIALDPESTLIQPVAVDVSIGANFGSLMVSAVIGDVSWVAAKDDEQVAILRIVDTNPNLKKLQATRVGCLDVDAGAMAMQDLDGDGLPEVFVGTSKGVSLFDGDSLGASCSEGAEAAQSVKCDDFADEDLVGDCGESASVAVGDVNGDGDFELLVGLPGTTVRGKTGAGAVFAVALKAGSEASDDAGNGEAADGGESDAGFEIDPDTMGPSIDLKVMRGMVDSDPNADSFLGYSVINARTYPGGKPRDEILAGSPGERAAFLFLCSGYEGDKPAKGLTKKCQPK